MGRGITTVAAASVVAAVAFAGYATGSVGVVAGTVDDVLVRSEKPKPKPKPWERTQREPGPGGSSSGFRERVAESGKAHSQPANGSEFGRVLDQRAAAQAARRANLRERLSQPDQPAAPTADDAFRGRVEAETGTSRVESPGSKDFRSRVGKKREKHKQRPFQKRVGGSGK